jgi:hypothetical protein
LVDWGIFIPISYGLVENIRCLVLVRLCQYGGY